MTYPPEPGWERRPPHDEWTPMPPTDPPGGPEGGHGQVYGQSPFGAASDPYPSDQYGQNPYAQSQYPQNPYGQNPYGQNQYPQNQYPQAYGQYAGYQNPYGYGATMRPETDGRAIASLICGVLSLPLAFMCSGLGLPLPIVAVVLGFLARRDIENSGGLKTGSGMALAGIITGAVGIVLMLLMLTVLGVSIADDFAAA
ncbi:DUF4190 domain-containing protein [Gordonia insulae]|uniref:DUF4190 domain-containing protein n=1 Tax=Gordonia insulae TaxID=2420509 RepID=UPI001E35953A|nr:DUF4190 domain-containing protein [Gordonia insulae]